MYMDLAINSKVSHALNLDLFYKGMVKQNDMASTFPHGDGSSRDSYKFTYYSVADPGFSRGGGVNPPGGA